MSRADRPHAGMARVSMAAAVVVSVLLAPALFTPSSLAPGWSLWTGSGCAWAAPDEIRVGIVVDFGTDDGAPSGPQAACVVVQQGATSADVLLAWSASTVGAPRYDVSGLLCAIGGYPASGCGERTGAGYRYWSYWEGGSGVWRYSSGNPHVQPARADRVEGWRFQESSGSGGDAQPPRRAPGGLCPDQPPTTTVPVTTASPTTVPPPATSTPTPVVTAPSTPVLVVTTTSPALPGGERPSTGEGEGPSASTDPAPPTAGSAGTADPRPRGVTATGTGSVPLIRADGADGGEMAAPVAPPGGDGGGTGGSPPVGVVVIVVVIAALGGSAAVRARRRVAP